MIVLKPHTAETLGLKARPFCNNSCLSTGPQNNANFLINNTHAVVEISPLYLALLGSVLINPLDAIKYISAVSLGSRMWHLAILLGTSADMCGSSHFCAGCSGADTYKLLPGVRCVSNWPHISPPICSKIRNILAKKQKILTPEVKALLFQNVKYKYIPRKVFRWSQYWLHFSFCRQVGDSTPSRRGACTVRSSLIFCIC